MPRSLAETQDVERSAEIGMSSDKPTAKIDRRISVAPMMDWIDDLQTSLPIKLLRSAENACLLYVSSKPSDLAINSVEGHGRVRAVCVNAPR